MIRMPLKILALALTMLLAASSASFVHAAPVKLDCIFEHYSSDDGLPHNSIADIHQDRNGYIWLATWYGLSRFDGSSFVNHTVLPGDYANLTHNRILSIDEDNLGYLWLTTYDYRLYRFDTSTEEFVGIPDGIAGSGYRNQKVTTFHCASDGNTWVSMPKIGLFRVSPDLQMQDWFNSPKTGREVSAIYEDLDGVVYAVSEVGITAFRDGNPDLLSRESEVVGFETSGDRLYFLLEHSLLVVDKKSGRQTNLPFDDKLKATTISLTGSGQKSLYIGFDSGTVASLDMDSLALDYHREDMGRVRYLFPDPEGLLWIATDRTGIWSYDDGGRGFRHYEHPRNVMGYYVDTLARVVNHDGRMWIKMNNYGFGWYDRENDTIVPLYNVKDMPGSRFMNGVACYEIDESGVLWFSTVQRGLERVTFITPRVETVVPPTRSDEPFAASEIRAVLRDSHDYVWVAAKSRELYRYSPDMSSCYRVPGCESFGIVYSIFEDDRGNIWLGSKGDGAVRLELSGDGVNYRARYFRHSDDDRNSLSSDNIYSITQDKDGRMWFGTWGGGLSMLESPDSSSFRTVYDDFPDYPLENGDRVRYVWCMPDGRMLVATIAGLIWFYPDATPELTKFHFVQKIPGDIHSLGNNDIIYIFDDSAGDTWLCTFGGGINRIHFEGDVPRYDIVSTADGLSSNIVLSAVADSTGDIWLATETGISRLRRGDSSVTNYTKYDGIVSTTFSEATCTRLRDGDIVFGTLNNLYRLDPADFSYSAAPKRLTFTGFRIDGDRVHPDGGRFVIPSGYSFFRIDFASLNFRIQNKIRFEYKLEGYDKNWIASESGSVTYSRIPHGNYRFTVRASTVDGNPETETISLNLRVRPSVWVSTPAKILYFLAVALVLLILFKMLLTSVKLKNDMALEQNLNDLKARFFTNISHELRTPLTLILGGVEEIRKDSPRDGKSAYSVNMVYRNVRRMMTLVDQLLDLRRIDSGKMKLQVRRIDLVKLLQSVSDDFKDMAREHRMELRLSHSADSLLIWGDEGRLEALIYNLLSNAFKYTADGGCIEAGIYWKEGDGSVRLIVRDNGVGIPRDKRAAIFEPFIQASDASAKGMPSSGIGLSFCKEIVELHGGSIAVDSQVGRGSEFTVTLPLGRDHFKEGSAEFVDDAMIADDRPAGTGGGKLHSTYPEGALKVLVVEDNTELCVYIYNSLIDRYEVRDAFNGKEALEIIASGWMPDMVITDLMMPVMDGIEFTNRIRGDFNTSHIPIIMITAKHESDTHLQAMKYGADGYIAKPFSMELLTAKMENLLQRRQTLISKISESSRNGDSRSALVNISPDEIVITDRDEKLIKKVMDWLEENIADPSVGVENLATYLGMSRTAMYNKLKGLTRKSPVELIQDFRLERATVYLRSGQYSVSEICYKVGFSDPVYFSRSFKKHFGMTPTDYIKKHRKQSDD